MARTLLMAMFVAVLANVAAAASSTFDTDDEGWTITGDAQAGGAEPTHNGTGGNPGGYIAATDDVQGGVWYFRAPASFHGDFSSGYGTNLTFDLQQSSLSNQFNAVDIYLRGAGLELRYDTASNPGIDWTNYSVLLQEQAGWTLNGSAPTQAEFLQVLGDVTDLQIRGEYIPGPDVGGLDNVVFVPEPVGLLSLTVAWAGLGLRRRRNRSA